MDCTEIRPLISAYYDGEATPEEHIRVERHLATCQDCRHALAEYRAIGGGIRALPVPVPPTGLRRDVWRAIDAQYPARSATRVTPRPRNVTTIAEKQRARKPAPVLASLGRVWGGPMVAGTLLAAMLLLFIVGILIRGQLPSETAGLENSSPGYTEPVHVRFAKSVDGVDARAHTSVLRVEGDKRVDVAGTSKSYDAATKTLTISPEGRWDAGAKYEVYIDAPNIKLGVGEEKLGNSPIILAFQTAAYTPTVTNTATATPTSVPTKEPTNTREPTATAQIVIVTSTPEAPGISPTAVVEPSATNTVVPATATRTLVPTRTYEPSQTPRPTLTPVLTGTPTAVPTGTPTPRKGSPTPSVTVTAVRGTPTPTPPCGIMPVNGFGKLWKENAEVRNGLGCPIAYEIGIQQAAQEHFQGGYMFWRGDTKTIYVFLGDDSGKWYAFSDTWTDEEPTPEPLTPPRGYYEPVRGFGKIWRTYPALQQSLGWATDQETAVTAAWQPFTRGSALWTSDRIIRVLFDNNAWLGFPDTFVTPTPTGVRKPPGE
jgi:hypothetical protein